MPAIKPLSEFTRNQNAVISQLAETGEPLYLTRNGSACVVVMDAAAFDEAMEYRNEVFEHEIRVKRELLAAYEDARQGNVVDLDEGIRGLSREKGWGLS